MSTRRLRTLAWSVWLVCALALAGCPSPDRQVRDDQTAGRPERGVATSVQAEDDFQNAAQLWAQGDPLSYSRVQDLLESAVEKDASMAVAWFNLGVVREAMGDRSGATEAYRRSNAADPDNVNGLANIGAMLLEEEQVAQAEQLLLQVIEAQQFHPEANLNLASIHRQRARQGDFVNREEADQAINHIRMSLAGDAMNVHAYETLAAVYFDLQQYSLARLVCVNAITLELDSTDLRNRLGLIALADNDVTTAYAQFRQAITKDERNLDALMNLGAIALNYRDYDGAFQAFDRALALRPDNAEIMLSRAVALRGLEDYEGAEQGYQAVLALEPGNLQAMYNLAILYQEYLADYDAALTWYENYLRQDPGRRSEQASDVQTRIDLTRQLIEIRQMYGEQPTGPAQEEQPPEPPAPEDQQDFSTPD
ncbi:MAG: tetratricopeptide repeat protein [Bradymonadales bacterium]|nr:tetratricopeptide repeat protein [Bradymonadales bacterium]